MLIHSSVADLASIGAPVHLAIGVFDGVHRGHRAVIESAVASASCDGGVAVLVTFNPHPVRLLAPDKAPRMLTSHAHKLSLVGALGVDHAMVISFDRAFSQLTGGEFVELLLKHAPALASIHVGEAWCFGRNRTGNVAMLTSEGAAKGFGVHAVPHVALRGETVSSTIVRRAVETGDLSRAEALLGRPFAVLGVVEKGRRMGRELGFPTANLAVADLQLPPYGVYVSRVKMLASGKSYGGVANLGVRPTVADNDPVPVLEVHLFDFVGELYGETLEVSLHKCLRQEKHFDGIGPLKAQIGDDVAAAKVVLSD